MADTISSKTEFEIKDAKSSKISFQVRNPKLSTRNAKESNIFQKIQILEEKTSKNKNCLDHPDELHPHWNS